MVSMVLFGAGASFGSGETYFGPNGKALSVPLGDQLYGRLEAEGGVAGSVPDHIKQHLMAPGGFETGMQALLQERPDDGPAFQRQLASHLAQYEPGPSNLYVRLLKSIKPQRVILATLNYDLMIELAAARQCGGMVTHYGPDYQVGQLRLLKLHGSCNFWPRVGNSVFKNNTFGNTAKAHISAPVDCVSQPEAIVRCKSDTSLHPAMAFYAPGKQVMSCPEFVASQQEAWRAALAKAGRVFVIGARIIPGDAHLWEPLAATTAEVTYFGGESDQTAYHAWQAAHDHKGPRRFARLYFADACAVIAHRL